MTTFYRRITACQQKRAVMLAGSRGGMPFSTDRMQKEGVQRFVDDFEEQIIKREFPAAVKSNFLKNDLKALAYANDIDWKDYLTCLRNLTAPVMLFAGEKDPASKFLPEIKALIPNCEMHILQGKDHAQTYWEGGTVAPLVDQFIAKTTNHTPQPTA